MREVAAHLGNTPAVARASYVDPRLIERFLEGRRWEMREPLVDGDIGRWLVLDRAWIWRWGDARHPQQTPVC